MRHLRAHVTLALACALLGVALVPRASLAAEVTLGATEFRVTMNALHASIHVATSDRPRYVELLLRNRFEESWFVQEMEVSGGAGTFTATLDATTHRTPNTPLGYKFRVTAADGTQTLSEERQVTITDDRFEWQVMQGRLVRLHWYRGDAQFARRALAVGEKAVSDVSKLLGVTETEPIDFFVYSSIEAFRTALVGIPENAAGQANTSIRTLFALIEPAQINSSWVQVVIPHELTHLVFNTAIDNPYHEPPRWLNEGLAVYLSEGLGAADRVRLDSAEQRGGLIPLDGLTTQFPTSGDKFFLSYAESVSAVDFFIRRYGQPTLVKLVRSYASGVTDDEAFRAATGGDVKAFNAAWFKDLGVDVPQPLGPRPPPPGPVPPGWTASPQPAATASAAGSPGVVPSGPALPGAPVGGGGSTDSIAPLLALLVLGVIGAAIVLAVAATRTRARRARLPVDSPAADTEPPDAPGRPG